MLSDSSLVCPWPERSAGAEIRGALLVGLGLGVGPGVTTVDYRDFAPILDRGYDASLLEGRETVHFAVIKTLREREAANGMVLDFERRWRRYYPTVRPTVVVLGVNPRAVTGGGLHAGTWASTRAARHCRHVLNAMCDAAEEQGMVSLGHLAESGESGRLERALGIPGMYVPCGVYGVGYAASM